MGQYAAQFGAQNQPFGGVVMGHKNGFSNIINDSKRKLKTFLESVYGMPIMLERETDVIVGQQLIKWKAIKFKKESS